MVNRSRDNLALYRNEVGVITPGVHGLEVILYSEIDNYRCTRKSINAIFPYEFRDEVLGKVYSAAVKYLDKLSAAVKHSDKIMLDRASRVV